MLAAGFALPPPPLTGNVGFRFLDGALYPSWAIPFCFPAPLLSPCQLPTTPRMSLTITFPLLAQLEFLCGGAPLPSSLGPASACPTPPCWYPGLHLSASPFVWLLSPPALFTTSPVLLPPELGPSEL